MTRRPRILHALRMGVWIVLLVVLLGRGGGAAGDEGVIADLSFLDPLEHGGPLYSGHVRIDLSPRSNRPFPLLLDTGAQGSVMTPLYARALRVSVRKHKSDSYRRSTIMGRDIEFMVATRSSESGSRTGWEYGLIGGDFLRAYVVEVDYQRRRVRFLDPERWPVSEETAEPGEWVLPMGETDGRPTVRIGLGEGAADFLMDTGAPMDLMISERKAAELGIDIPDDSRLERGQNVLGQDLSASFFVAGIRVGENTVRNLTLNVTLGEGSTYQTTNVAGVDEALLGNTFLSRFRVRFDYVHGRVGLLPVVEPDPPRDALPHLPRSGPDSAVSTRPVFVPVDLSPARAARRYEQEVWLRVDAPGEDDRVAGDVPWADVRGWAGAGQSIEQDLVVVIDVSGSTALASGSDIDGDGKVGRVSRRARDGWRTFNPSRLSSDPDDTILAAERAATLRLIDHLDPGSSRVGLVSFANAARLEAPVGSSRVQLEAAYANLERAFGSGATNMARAIELATEALLASRPADQPDRRQSIVLLSDGYPTAPDDPEQAAYLAARAAAERGVRIYTFALGLVDFEPDDIFPEIAFVTGGQHVRVEKPGEIVHELSRIRLTDIADVEVENLTTGAVGRATRLFPDGSFDSLLQLEPGPNAIRITAIGDAGGRASAERVLDFRPSERPDPEAVEAFRERLRVRTAETELVIRAEGGAREFEQPRREVEVEVEDEDE